MKLFFIILFFVFLSLDLYFVHKNFHRKRFFSKTILLPILILFYLFSSKNINFLLIGALFMSFLGDTFLLFENRKNFFKLGLFSFLIAHIFYLLTFLSTSNFLSGNIPNYIYIFLIPYIIYGLLFYKFLFPEIEKLKIEILVYIIAIILMSFFTIPRFYLFPIKNSLPTFIGSILFIISDSLLSIQIFKGKIKKNSISIMLSYSLAQLLIVLSFVY